MPKYIIASSLAITLLATAVSVQAKGRSVEPQFTWPVSNHVGTTYWGHQGRDFVADLGGVVKAAEAGTVFRSNCSDTWNRGNGCVVILRHDSDYKTMYAHLQEGSLISGGSKVKQGDVIGRIGITGRTTGPHLHFEIRKLINGTMQSLEPLDYLQQ